MRPSPALLAYVLVAASPAAAQELRLDHAVLDEVALWIPLADGLAGAPGDRKKAREDPPPVVAFAPGTLGVGLQVGTPTALTFKFPAANGAIVLGVGAGYATRGGFFGLSLHGDYLLTVAPLIVGGPVELNAYLGPGIWMTLFTGGYGYGYGYYYARSDLFGLAARFPIGVSAMFAAAPVEVYLELDPALFVFPGIDVFIGASLGFRWYF